MTDRAPTKKHRGVVVPMITPVRADGGLDEAAVERLVEFFIGGGVHGVFVLGTTGEAPSVPADIRDRLVDRVRARSAGRLQIYAGISGNSLVDSVSAGRRYLDAGADAVVAHVPSYYELQPHESLGYFTELADRLTRDLVVYNIPATTGISLSLDVCGTLAKHPGIVAIKDSENDRSRMDELLRRMGGRADFSVFVGTGALMADGLLNGADGIVPSAGNLAPRLCRDLFDAGQAKDLKRLGELHGRFMAVSGLYQKGRTLGQSLAALKSAMTWTGLCGPGVFSPLQTLGEADCRGLRDGLVGLGLPVDGFQADEDKTNHWTDDGRSGRSRAGTLPADAR
jgi:4-hydroxy-tetrahydrodipicolinate synthase